jgi:hypothetical protein
MHVLDGITRDTAHAAVVQMDAVPAGIANGVLHDIGGRARSHPGQVNAVVPAGDGKTLDRDLPAAVSRRRAGVPGAGAQEVVGCA